MKRDDVKKLMQQPAAELAQGLLEARNKLRTLQFDLDAGKVKNVAELRRIKKNIARRETALRMRETESKK